MGMFGIIPSPVYRVRSHPQSIIIKMVWYRHVPECDPLGFPAFPY